MNRTDVPWVIVAAAVALFMFGGLAWKVVAPSLREIRDHFLPRAPVQTSANFVELGYRRGDYVTFAAMSSYAETTSGLVRGPDTGKKHQRVLAATPKALTVRDVHRWQVVEWCHARLEDLRWWRSR